MTIDSDIKRLETSIVYFQKSAANRHETMTILRDRNADPNLIIAWQLLSEFASRNAMEALFVYNAFFSNRRQP